MNNSPRQIACFGLGLLVYACEAHARGRGCSPDGCSPFISVLSTAAVLYWLYFISRGRKIPWLGLVPHAVIIAATVYASASTRGAGAAFAALIIMLTIIHGGYKIVGARKIE